MKNIFLLVVTGFCIQACGQGRYAGSMKKLVGVIYTDSRNIPGLEGWEFIQGSVISALDDPEMILSQVYRKGTSQVVFFSIKPDSASPEHHIMDVVEVKNVVKGWQVMTSLCRQQQTENAAIVALVRWYPDREFLQPAKKAWLFNKDKRRFQVIPVRGIDCINEGLE